MGDVVFMVTVVAFFAIAVFYVRACGAIVGASDAVRTTDEDGDDREQDRDLDVAAPGVAR